MLLDQDPPGRASEHKELNFLPPPELNRSLLRSLLTNLRDRFFPERLPPLRLTSRPVNVGMLVGDILELPWYRTILKNLGDVISPDTLPPLQLESQPVEVELISDQPAWWRSLLRNLADTVAPERQPALRLSSPAVNPEMASEVLTTPRWSSLIPTPVSSTPLIARPRAARPDPLDYLTERPSRSAPMAAPLRTTLLHLPPLDPPTDDADEYEYEHKLVLQLRRSIRGYHIREFVWLGFIVAEVAILVALRLMPH